MEYKNIKKIIDNSSTIVEFGEYGEGVSNNWIQKAQKRLGVIFPPSYIWWLKNYSGGEINGYEVFSIYEIDFDIVVGGDIIYINEFST